MRPIGVVVPDDPGVGRDAHIAPPNNASVSTVENVSGSGARGTDDASYVTTTTVFCERVV